MLIIVERYFSEHFGGRMIGQTAPYILYRNYRLPVTTDKAYRNLLIGNVGSMQRSHPTFSNLTVYSTLDSKLTVSPKLIPA